MQFMGTLLYIVLTLTSCLIGGCNTILGGEIETVMCRGQKITATNGYGTIAITAGKGFKRYYTWDGETRSMTLDARGRRWYGSLGIYHPGCWSWKPVNGITRGVFEEGQIHFDTEDEVLAWLKLPYNGDYIYTHDGLVVGFLKTPERQQLNVDVWQIYIGGKVLSKYQCTATERVGIDDPNRLPDILKELNKKPVYVGGHKPQNLPGSQDDKITVEYPYDVSQ